MLLFKPAIIRRLWELDPDELPPDVFAMLGGFRGGGVLFGTTLVTSGSTSFTANGSWTVQPHNSVTFTIWGGGGGGGSNTAGGFGGGTSATAGGATTVTYLGTTYLQANGGSPGTDGYSVFGTGGAGGTATGGTTNTTGNSGVSPSTYDGGNGATAPGVGTGAGTGGVTNNNPGTNASDIGAGGGGAAGVAGAQGGGGGGGSGGRAQRTYSAGTLAVGSTVSIVVGAGGSGSDWSPSGCALGGNGFRGQVNISWS